MTSTAPVDSLAPHPVAFREFDNRSAIATVEMTGMAPAAHAECYRMATNNLLDIKVLTAAPHAILHGFFVGPLHVTFGEQSPHTARRTRALSTRDQFGDIVLQLTRTGRWHGRAGGQVVGGGPGALALFDFTQGFTVTDDDDRAFVYVLIPRGLAERMAGDPADLHGRMVDAAAGAVLAGFLNGLVGHAPALKAEQGPALADMLIELATLAFRTANDPVEERRGPDRRLRDRVERLVAQRLGARDLTPDWIASKLGISRSQLYALFPGGGVAKLIWRARLTAAHAVLTDPHEDRTIATIAALFGFASDAHFARAFRIRFGMTPSAARKAMTG